MAEKPTDAARNANAATKAILLTLKALQGRYEHEDLVGMLIQQVNDPSPIPRGIHGQVIEFLPDDRSLLNGPISILYRQERELRFLTLCGLLDAVPRKSPTHFWLNATGSAQLLAFTTEGENVNFIHPLGLRPWLTIALQRAGTASATLQKSVGLSGLGSLQGFAEDLRIFLKIKTVTTDPESIVPEISRGSGIDFLFPPPREKERRTRGRMDRRVTNNQSPESVALMYARNNTNRRTAVFATSTALTRNVGAEVHTRETLIYSKRIQAVVSIAASSMGAHVPSDRALLIVAPVTQEPKQIAFLDAGHKKLIEKSEAGINEKTGPVLWVELLSSQGKKLKDTPFLARISYESISKANLSLVPARHLEQTASSILMAFIRRNNSYYLREVANFIRPRSLTHSDDGSIHIREATISDIGEDGFLTPPAKTLSIEEKLEGTAIKQVLYPGDVVFSIKGRVGAVGIVPPAFGAEDDAYWVAGQSLMILRPNRMGKHANIILYSYLTHPIIQDHISTLVTGTTSDTITQADLENIPVVSPGRQEKEELVKNFSARMAKFIEIETLRASIAEEKRAAWPQVDEVTFIDEKDPFNDDEFPLS
ncbi:restriction endonuclease subunit S [Thalassospira alkalitolerans]|uniref:restriction endonuclease subunit S n=1 Tax=Thalassospira alkalitolerans TaxID=1293890 RepID=UPI003AA925FC